MSGRVVIYCRADDAEGVGRQVVACRALAESRGWSVDDVVSDRGRDSAERPRQARLVADDSVERVITWDVTRLCRSARGSALCEDSRPLPRTGGSETTAPRWRG